MWLPQDNKDEEKLFDRIRRVLRNLKCELEGTPIISGNTVRFQVKGHKATQRGAGYLRGNFLVIYDNTYIIDVKVDDGPGGYFVVIFS